MLDNDRVGLADVLLELRAAGYNGQSRYSSLYQCVVAGVIPAHRKTPRGWEIARTDFPAVASALGLTRSAPALVAAAGHINA